MAGYCDQSKGCKFFNEEVRKCDHPEYPRKKLYMREDGTQCGSYRSKVSKQEGLKEYRDKQKEKKKEKQEIIREENKKKKEEEKSERYELAKQRIKSIDGKITQFKSFAKLEPDTQKFLWLYLIEEHSKEDAGEVVWGNEVKHVIPKVNYLLKKPEVQTAIAEFHNMYNNVLTTKVDRITSEVIDSIEGKLHQLEHLNIIETTDLAKRLSDIKKNFVGESIENNNGNMIVFKGDVTLNTLIEKSKEQFDINNLEVIEEVIDYND